MNYWDTQGIPLRPAVRVKPLSRWYDHDFSCWMVEARVTSRFTGECGKVRSVRAYALYKRQGTLRGKCGKLYWAERMSYAELLKLPETVRG